MKNASSFGKNGATAEGIALNTMANHLSRHVELNYMG
jgi:hypothetical protein